MNRSLLILPAALLFMVAALSAAGLSTDVSGTWSGKHMPAGDGFPVEPPTAASLIVTQNGSTITGVFTGGASRSARIESGRIEENGKITFWLRDSQNYLVTAQLAVSGDWIRGRMTSSAGRVMNIALRKQ